VAYSATENHYLFLRIIGLELNINKHYYFGHINKSRCP
jgi:hypothetical protein